MTRNLDTTFRATDCKNKRVIAWVNIKDEIPEKRGKYLCSLTIDGAWHVKDYWFDRGEFQSTDASCITHWAETDQLKPTPKEPITTCQHSGIQFNSKGENVGFI